MTVELVAGMVGSIVSAVATRTVDHPGHFLFLRKRHHVREVTKQAPVIFRGRHADKCSASAPSAIGNSTNAKERSSINLTGK